MNVIRIVQAHPKKIIAGWSIFVLLAAVLALHLADTVKAGGFSDAHSQSARGQIINQKAFGEPENQLSVVLSSQTVIPQSAIDSLEQRLRNIEHVGNIEDGRHLPTLASESGQVQVIQVGIDADNTTAQNMVPGLREAVADELHGTQGTQGIESHVTGAAALDYDLNIQSQRDAQHAEMIAFPLLIVVLLIIYRAVGPTLVTLVVAGVSLAGVQGLGTVMGQFTELSNMYITGASLIGLAVAVDYCLFLISRYKEGLGAGLMPDDALRAATGTAGHAVRFGGLSVIAALCALFIARNMVFSSIAWAGIIVTLIAIAAVSTFVPALVTVLGPRLFFGKLPGFTMGPRSEGARRGAGESRPSGLRYPKTVAVGLTVLLLAAVVPLSGIKLQVPVASASILPDQMDSKRGVEAVNEELDSRQLFPTSVIFEAAPGQSASDVESQADSLAEKLSGKAGVDSVLAPAALGGASSPLALTGQLDGRAFARVMVVSSGAPDSDEAHDVVRMIRDETASDPHVLITGATAQGSDFDLLVEKSIPWIVMAVVGTSLVLLGWAFRSWRLPILAVILNALVVMAAMGLLSGGWKLLTGDSINSVTPVVVFAVVFGLSMDYMVLMAARMQEEWRKGREHETSIVTGLLRTSSLVVSAAAIMIGVFLSFLIAEISIVREIGIGLALAVGMDALLVRPFLLPAVLKLIGPKVWGRRPESRDTERLAVDVETPVPAAR